MSKTPRTNAAIASTKRAHGKAYEFVSAGFARKLERENAEMAEAMEMVLAIMCDKEICGHFLPREIREVIEPVLERINK